MFELTGQTAVVTGAATGIGAAIARRLSAAGATVAIADIDFEAASQMSGSIESSFPMELDVARADSVEGAFRDILARTGRVEILVNNAGIAGRPRLFGSRRSKNGNA